jgi:hypothetical protein
MDHPPCNLQSKYIRKAGKKLFSNTTEKPAYNAAEPTNFQIFAPKRKKAAGSIEKSTLPAANKCVVWIYSETAGVQIWNHSQNSE